MGMIGIAVILGIFQNFSACHFQKDEIFKLNNEINYKQKIWKEIIDQKFLI